MKNKKILSRVLAVIAALVLVVALAVPCFADEIPPIKDNQYVVGEIQFDTYDQMVNWYYENMTAIFAVKVYDYEVFYKTGDGFCSYSMSLFDQQVVHTTFVIKSFNFNNGDCYYEELFGNYSAGEVALTSIYKSNLNPSDVVFLYYTTASSGGSDAPTRSGMFGQLFTIIKDAIFGQDAVLDSTQEFTLTQISTWMTYIVLLLPIFVVAAILIKCFR